MTIEYIRWFALKASKKGFGAATWAVYSCLVADCAISREPRVFTTKSALAARLKLGRQTISSSFEELARAGLICADGSGVIDLIAPDPSWLNKVNAKSETKHQEISPINSRTRKAANPGPPSKGEGPRNFAPTATAPTESSRAKGLTSAQNIQMRKRLGWVIPVELQRFAAQYPDEVWIDPNC